MRQQQVDPSPGLRHFTQGVGKDNDMDQEQFDGAVSRCRTYAETFYDNQDFKNKYEEVFSIV